VVAEASLMQPLFVANLPLIYACFRPCYPAVSAVIGGCFLPNGFRGLARCVKNIFVAGAEGWPFPVSRVIRRCRRVLLQIRCISSKNGPALAWPPGLSSRARQDGRSISA
jgi:hypothetical protein